MTDAGESPTKGTRRYWTQVRVVLAVALAAVLIALGVIAGSWAQRREAVEAEGYTAMDLYNIYPLTSRHHVWALHAGDWIECLLAVTSEPNNIHFYVTDPVGVRIVDARGVSGYSCRIEAHRTGNYTFVFDNTAAWFTSRMVSISWRSNRRLIGGGG